MTKLLFFGKLRDLAGEAEKPLTLPDGVDTLARLITWLKTEDPLLGAAIDDKTVRYCINMEICGTDTPVTANDEIAFMPPLSGG